MFKLLPIVSIIALLLFGGWYVVDEFGLRTRIDQIEDRISKNLGADTNLFVGGQVYTLAGSGVSGSATSITLTSLTIPQTGQELQDSDFASTFYATIEPGNSTRQEFVSCTTVTQGSGSTATLSGCSRGLAPIAPYTASTTLQFAHAGGTKLIFSNSPNFYDQATFKGNDETITGAWTFTTAASSTDECSAVTEYCTKNYIDSGLNQGAATSTEFVMGLVELANRTEVGVGTASSSAGGPLVIPNYFSTTTPGALCTAGTWNCLVATVSGKMSQAFLDLTAQWNFTSSGVGTGIFATNASTTNATTTTSIAWGLVNMLVPQSAPTASSTVPCLSGSSPFQMSFCPQGAALAVSAAEVTSTNSATTTSYTITVPANTFNTSTLVRGSVQTYDGGAGSGCFYSIVMGNGSSTSSPFAYWASLGESKFTISATSTSAKYATSLSWGNGFTANSTVALGTTAFVGRTHGVFSNASPLYIGLQIRANSDTCNFAGISGEVFSQK